MYTTIRKLSLLLLATAALAPVAQAVVTYNLTTPYYYKDGISVESDPNFVQGTRGDFYAGASSSYSCNDKLPTGYYASKWQLATATRYPSLQVIQTWTDTDSITVTFDSAWQKTYGNYLNLVVSIDQKQYSYSYDAGGGTWVNPPSGGSDVKYWTSQTAATASCVSKEGHTFSKWYCSKGTYHEAGSTFTGDSLGISSNGETVELTAQWTANQYDLNLQLANGAGVAKIYYKVNGANSYTAITSSKTVKVNYGTTWYAYAVAADGYKYTATSEETPKQDTMTTEGATFAPVATPQSYTISTGVSPSGSGSVSGGGTYSYGEKATLTATEYNGYAFAQWQDGNTENPRTITVTGKATYTAQFEKLQYTVTYHPGTYGTGDEQSATKSHGTTLTLKDALFTRAGYQQTGWSYSEVGTTRNFDLTGSYSKDESTTLYPYWTPDEFTITIYPGHAEGKIETKTYKTGTANQTVNISQPSRGGYAFATWTTDFSGVTGTPPTVNSTSILIPAGTFGHFSITATWTAQSNKITVSANGGSGGSSVNYCASNEVQTVAFTNPIRGGYEIGSWSVGSGWTGTEPTVADEQVTIPANTYGNFTITPSWSGQTYTATIAPGEGGAGGESTSYTVSSSQWTWDFTAPTRTGHHIGSWAFSGWNTSKPSIYESTLTIPENAYGNIVCTPTWVANQYSISLDSNGGGSVKSSPSSQSQAYGTEIKITATANEGYAFAYWQSTATASPIYENPHTFTIDQDVEFTAYFTNKIYTVTFDARGGSCAEEKRSVAYNSAIGALPTPTYGTRDFQGWYNDSIGGSQITQDTVIYGDKTIYARWGEAVTYTITTIASPEAGGTITGGGVHDKDSETTLVATPNEGYSFVKWADEETSATRPITVTRDATYTACFTGKVYDVSFMANGGSNPPESKVVRYGEPYGELGEPTPPSGKYFSGWYTKKSGGELIKQDSIVAIIPPEDYPITLYAHYSDIVYAYHYVRFDGNGATNKAEMAVQKFTIGVEQALAANEYAAIGCSFAGWATNSGDAAACRVAYTNCQVVSFPEAKENETNLLYAVWQRNSYPLELRPGNGVSNITYTVSGEEQQQTTVETNIFVICGTNWDATAYAKVGYHFGSESTVITDAAGTMTDAGAVFAPTGTPNTITLTYVGYDSTGGSTSASAFCYDQAGNLTSNGFVKVHAVTFDAKGGSPTPPAATSVWKFVEWNNRRDGSGSYHYDDGATVTNVCGATKGTTMLYAQWTTNEASVVTLPAAPTCEGFTFLGWGQKAQVKDESPDPCWAAGDKWTPTQQDIYDKKLTFYAYWKEIPNGALHLEIGTGIEKIYYWYGVDAEPAGDATASSRQWTETTTNAYISLDVGESWSAYAVAKIGYTYTETSSSHPTNGTMKAGGSAAFSPKATPKSYDVTYYGNGDTGGKMEASKFTYDKAELLSSNAYERIYAVTFDPDGGMVTNASGEVWDPAVASSVYKFDGWATNLEDAASRRVSYADGQTVSNICGSTDAPVALYAVWTTNGASVITLPGVVREDYLFTGWKDAVSHRVYEIGATVIPTNGMSFVAQWRINLSDLSTAVGLTNAVLHSVADEPVDWKAQDRETEIVGWDADHDQYIRLINSSDSTKEVSTNTSPLKLSMKVYSPGKLRFQLYYNWAYTPRPVIVIEDFVTRDDGFTYTNALRTLSPSGTLSWEDGEMVCEITGAGQHEIRWLVDGTIRTKATTAVIALDNMTWTPDEAPEPTPVTPGSEIDVPSGKTATDFAADLTTNATLKASYLKAPDGVTTTDAYRSYFDAAPSSGGTTVTFVLNETGTNAVVEATYVADTNALAVALSTNETTLVIGTPLVGFYYSLKQGGAVTNLGFRVEGDRNKLGKDEISFELDKPKDAGFYQMFVTPSQYAE